MEDKDFLGYFNKLSPPASTEEIKGAAAKIVNTLVVIGAKGAVEGQNKASEDAEKAIKAKYQTGDLGEKVSADLNYTLKRLVRGLYSENHQVKQGFFLASVLVLSKFRSVIDFEKYLKHVFAETKVHGSMKSSEGNNMSLGRMMAMSACIEARIFLPPTQQVQASQVNQRTLNVIVQCLVELYNGNDFLQEPISAVFTKLLTILKEFKQIGLSALEIIVEQLIIKKKGQGDAHSGSFDFRANILQDSNRLALYLRLKEIYQNAGYSGQSKEYEEIFAYKILSDKKNLKMIQALVTKQTYLYPRLHSSLNLLMNEITQGEVKTQERARLTQQLISTLLDEHLFNEEVYADLKSTAKFKFLFIGFKFWQLIVKSIQSWDVKNKFREQLLDSLLSPHFVRVLVKNISNPKAQLHSEATQAKSTLINYLIQTNEADDAHALSSAFAFKLLSQRLFGANTLTRLSIRKHVDLVKVLCSRMEVKEVKAYYEVMKNMFENPQVEETFGQLMQFKDEGGAEEVKLDDDNEDEEDPRKKDEKQKGDIIRTYALNQLASIPTMFRGKNLDQQILSDIIKFLVHLNYYAKHQSDEIHQLAQFKLYGLVQVLYNVKVGDGVNKGLKSSEGELWILEVNSQIQKQAKKQNAMLGAHKDTLDFIKEQVTSYRLKSLKKLSSTDLELAVREKQRYKRLLSFELLFHNLALLLMIPEMFEEIQDNIEELQICYLKLGLQNSEESGNKRQKKDKKPATPKTADYNEALSVLTDFLVGLLAKPQSFLRDVANFTFKQFCTEVPAETLGNLLKIVLTPNVEAGIMLYGENDEDKREEEGRDDDDSDEDDSEDDEDDSEDDEDESD